MKIAPGKKFTVWINTKLYKGPKIKGMLSSMHITKLKTFPYSSLSTHLDNIAFKIGFVIDPKIWTPEAT